MRIIKSVSLISVCWAMPAMAADAPDFNTFYNLYKALESPNNISITSDILSTRLLNTPGAQSTIIDVGNFDFNGGRYVGFVISNGHNFSLANGGTFSGDTIEKSINNFSNSAQGGVISNLGGGVEINNSAFANNTSSAGGAVFYQGANSTADILNSVFQSNRASRGDGGVIYNEYKSSATFTNSVFTSNSARDYGGVAFNDGTLNISGGTFTSNSADSGGALYNSNTINISDSSFTGNTATAGPGAIYTTGMMNLKNSVFENNSGDTGGAIGNYGIIGDTLYSVIQGSVFNNNSAEYGGAIYNWDDIYVIDSQFNNNTASTDGGAIHNLSELYLIALNNDVSFTGNTVNGASNAIQSSGTITMNASPGYNIIFDDAIGGDGNININRPYIFDSKDVPTGGNIILNADMSGFSGDITQFNGTMQIAENGTFFNAKNLNIQGGTLDIGTHEINASSISFGENATLVLGVANADTYGYVNADTYSIENGANLNVILQPNAMGSNSTMRLHLLRSANEILDNFTPQINNNLYAFSQIGNGWYVVESVAEYDDIIRDMGGTQNNINTATAWQDAPPASHTTGRELYLQMNALLQTNAIGYIRALSALAPSPAPLTQIIGTQLISRTDNMINGPRNEYDTGNGKIWVSGVGSGGQLDSAIQYSEFDMHGIGGAVGTEYKIADAIFGAAYTFQYDKISNWARDIRASTDGGAIYIKYNPGNFALRGATAIFYTDIHEIKNAANLRLDNNTSAYTYSAWSDIGYKISPYNWDITPRVGTRYTLIHRATSTDEAGQTISGDNLHFWTAYTDTTIAYNNFDFHGIKFVPSVNIGASYDMRSDNDIFNIAINNNKYNIVGDKLPRLAGNIGTELGIIFNESGELRIGINAQLRNDYNNISAMIRAALRF